MEFGSGGIGGGSGGGSPSINNSLTQSSGGTGGGGGWDAAIAAGLNLYGTMETNRENRYQSRANMNWQEYMSNTAYCRAVRDLKKAGLNPMLAYSQGGASTGSGAQAEMENAIGASLTSAMDMKRLTEEVSVMKANKENIQQSTLESKAREKLTTAEAFNATQEGKIKEAAGRAAGMINDGLKTIDKIKTGAKDLTKKAIDKWQPQGTSGSQHIKPHGQINNLWK